MKKALAAVIILLFSLSLANISLINSDIDNEFIKNENINAKSNELKLSNPPIEIVTLSENFGDQKDFWTANLQTGDWFQVRATLLAKGNHCYIYMDNRTIDSIGQSTAIEKSEICSYEFDTTVYPKNFELVGHPNGTLGDFDNDLRITVFLVQGVGNYYLQHNELPGYLYSNNREMVYVSSQMPIINTIATMCHETNHLFLFNYDLDEARFIIEGLAEFSMYYAGYMSNYSFMQGEMSINRTMSSVYYSDHPDVSLFFFDRDYYAYSTYGAGYMFLFYLAEKYGIQIISDLIPDDALDGPAGIETALMQNGFNISFNEIFLDFIAACTIDKTGIYDDLYGFTNTEFQISNRRIIRSLPFSSVDIKHRSYGIEINELENPPNEFTLQIETPDYPRSLGISSVIHDQNGWNVSKMIITGDGNTANIQYNGENIEKAYIVTSMINEGTPDAIKEWMESPFELLDFKFEAGHTTSEPEKTTSAFLFGLSLILVIIIILKRKR